MPAYSWGLHRSGDAAVGIDAHHQDAELRRRLRHEYGIELESLCPMLRESEIITTPERPGLLKLTRTPFRKAVADGYIPKPVKLGPKVRAWPRMVIVRVMLDGTSLPREGRARASEAEPA
jgi:predicted DNA-binding transcriptional regulator AlpA